MKKVVALVLSLTLMLCVGALALAADVQLSFGGSSTGGMLYYLAGAFTTTVSPLVDGVNITNVTTGASVDNAIRIARDELDFGFTYSSLVYEAATGTGNFADEPLKSMASNIQGVCKAYDSDFYIVALASSGIKTLEDLNGKTVSLGSPGSGTQYVADMVMDAFGINCTRQYLSFGDTSTAMKEGSIDAVAMCGSPASGVTELAETENVIIIPFSDEQIAQLKDGSPFFYAECMPAGRYRGMDEPVQVPHFRSYWIVNKNVDADLLYRILEATFQESTLEELRAGHNNWSYVAEDTEGFEALGLEIHPGAKKFFEDHPEVPHAN